MTGGLATWVPFWSSVAGLGLWGLSGLVIYRKDVGKWATTLGVYRRWKMKRRVGVRWFVFNFDEGRRIGDVLTVSRRSGESVMVEVPDDSVHTVGVQLRVPEHYRLQFSDQRIQDRAHPVKVDGFVTYTLNFDPFAQPARFTATLHLVFGDWFIE